MSKPEYVTSTRGVNVADKRKRLFKCSTVHKRCSNQLFRTATTTAANRLCPNASEVPPPPSKKTNGSMISSFRQNLIHKYGSIGFCMDLFYSRSSFLANVLGNRRTSR